MNTQKHNQMQMYFHVLFNTGFWKSFKRIRATVVMAKRAKCPVWKPKVDGSIPGGDIWNQAWHSPVVIIQV